MSASPLARAIAPQPRQIDLSAPDESEATYPLKTSSGAAASIEPIRKLCLSLATRRGVTLHWTETPPTASRFTSEETDALLQIVLEAIQTANSETIGVHVRPDGICEIEYSAAAACAVAPRSS